MTEIPATVTDPLACRLIAINAYIAWQNQLASGAVIREPKPGDLVLEITTSFRWMRRENLAPGEALGWLLRVEKGATEYEDVHVVRPIFEAEGEFRWSNCKLIPVATELPR